AEEEVVADLLAEPRQREVRGIRFHRRSFFSPLGIEAPDQLRSALEALRSGHVLDPVLLPKAARIAEGRHAALGADARAGEHEDPLAALDQKRAKLVSGSDLRNRHHRSINGCAARPRLQGSRYATEARAVAQ